MSKFATIINNNVVWQIVNDMNSSSCPPLRDYSFGNHKNNNEETEDQIFGDIFCLLVCTFSLAGGWSSEIPDTG